MNSRTEVFETFFLALLLFCGVALVASLAPPRPALADEEPAGEVRTEEEADAEEQETGSLRRSDRMEFDARLVRGQKATSGAVYLFQRAPRPLPPLVVLRQSYLDRIVEPVLGKQEGDVGEEERP